VPKRVTITPEPVQHDQRGVAVGEIDLVASVADLFRSQLAEIAGVILLVPGSPIQQACHLLATAQLPGLDAGELSIQHLTHEQHLMSADVLAFDVTTQVDLQITESLCELLAPRQQVPGLHLEVLVRRATQMGQLLNHFFDRRRHAQLESGGIDDHPVTTQLRP
jgi:hypothetical protein